MDTERRALAEAVAGLRAVLAEVESEDSELTASPVTRRRIEGAALALEVLVQRPEAARPE